MKRKLKLSLNEMADQLQVVPTEELLNMIGGGGPDTLVYGTCFFDSIEEAMASIGKPFNKKAAMTAFGRKYYDPNQAVIIGMYGSSSQYADSVYYNYALQGPRNMENAVEFANNYIPTSLVNTDQISSAFIPGYGNSSGIYFATFGTGRYEYDSIAKKDLEIFHTSRVFAIDASSNTYILVEPDGSTMLIDGNKITGGFHMNP